MHSSRKKRIPKQVSQSDELWIKTGKWQLGREVKVTTFVWRLKWSTPHTPWTRIIYVSLSCRSIQKRIHWIKQSAVNSMQHYFDYQPSSSKLMAGFILYFSVSSSSSSLFLFFCLSTCSLMHSFHSLLSPALIVNATEISTCLCLHLSFACDLQKHKINDWNRFFFGHEVLF